MLGSHDAASYIWLYIWYQPFLYIWSTSLPVLKLYGMTEDVLSLRKFIHHTRSSSRLVWGGLQIHRRMRGCCVCQLLMQGQYSVPTDNTSPGGETKMARPLQTHYMQDLMFICCFTEETQAKSTQTLPTSLLLTMLEFACIQTAYCRPIYYRLCGHVPETELWC